MKKIREILDCERIDENWKETFNGLMFTHYIQPNHPDDCGNESFIIVFKNFRIGVVCESNKVIPTTRIDDIGWKLIHELAFDKYNKEKSGIEKDINRFKNNPKKHNRKQSRLNELNISLTDIEKLKELF